VATIRFDDTGLRVAVKRVCVRSKAQDALVPDGGLLFPAFFFFFRRQEMSNDRETSPISSELLLVSLGGA
jgi:hypothetical protein